MTRAANVALHLVPAVLLVVAIATLPIGYYTPRRIGSPPEPQF
jgi:hypothetical protein